MVAQDPMVYMPVPADLYADVLGFLAERLGGAEAEVTPTPEPDAPDLDDALVRRIYEESWETHRKLLKILASHAGEWVTYARLSKEMGYANPRQLPGTLGALGRRAKHRYGGIWPFEPRWTGEHWEARMELEVADIIRDL